MYRLPLAHRIGFSHPLQKSPPPVFRLMCWHGDNVILKMASGIELAHLPTGMFSPFINGQEILEEEYNEDFEPTDEGLLFLNE